MVMSLILLAPSWGGMINGMMTLSGAWHKLRDDPILRFLVVSLAFYGMSTFEGPMMAIKTVPMERLFRSLKSEWVPSTGYLTAQEAQRDISHYLMHRYNWIRPHQFNDGLPPAVAEEKLNRLGLGGHRLIGVGLGVG